MTTSLVYHAAAQGIIIDEVESQYEGDIDLRGFLGLSNTVRKGFQHIDVQFKVKSDADAETLQELIKKSPVYDIVTNPVPVTISLEKK